MNAIILGAAGFIGTNLAMELLKDSTNYLTLVDRCENFFIDTLKEIGLINLKEEELKPNMTEKREGMSHDIP